MNKIKLEISATTAEMQSQQLSDYIKTKDAITSFEATSIATTNYWFTIGSHNINGSLVGLFEKQASEAQEMANLTQKLANSTRKISERVANLFNLASLDKINKSTKVKTPKDTLKPPKPLKFKDVSTLKLELADLQRNLRLIPPENTIEIEEKKQQIRKLQRLIPNDLHAKVIPNL